MLPRGGLFSHLYARARALLLVVDAVKHFQAQHDAYSQGLESVSPWALRQGASRVLRQRLVGSKAERGDDLVTFVAVMAVTAAGCKPPVRTGQPFGEVAGREANRPRQKQDQDSR